MRISLVQFFKTYQKYLAYAFLGLFISLLRFLYLANTILGLFISLLQFFGQKQTKNCRSEVNSPKTRISKNSSNEINSKTIA